jgi:hypothetical protein
MCLENYKRKETKEKKRKQLTFLPSRPEGRRKACSPAQRRSGPVQRRSGRAAQLPPLSLAQFGRILSGPAQQVAAAAGHLPSSLFR